MREREKDVDAAANVVFHFRRCAFQARLLLQL